MKYLIDSTQMKAIDDYTIDVLKIPAVVLMERAALEAATVIKNKINNTDRILVVCGPGNNGGDGIAAGRILFLQGYYVAILFIGNYNKISELMKVQLEIAKNLGIPIENSNKLSEYNIIIDAIFGVGLTRLVTGDYETIIQLINDNVHHVFSIDIPSGISADNGKVLNIAVQADETITFGHKKIGLQLYPGADYAGKITVADIGFPEIATNQANINTFTYDTEDLKLLPQRKNYSNKGVYGKVLVIAGSKGVSGAAYLSAKAAYRSGAGLVKVLTSKENRIILQSALPEALFAAYDEKDLGVEEQKQYILSQLAWATVVIIGPGLGTDNVPTQLLEMVLQYTKVPIIIDADGITLLANQLNRAQLSSAERIKHLLSLLPEETVLTPHLLELSRLIGVPVTDIANNLIDTANQCSYNNKLIYAMKDARTLVTQGRRKFINTSGNHGMATGGSGDVLTGIIAAFIAQGMKPFDATCLAVFVHGLSGDAAVKEKGTYSMIASDIIDYMEKVLQRADNMDY
jgi:NAD(P)H-hydrate epimerase